MRLVQQTIIRKSNACYNELEGLCHKSKNLYNASLYAIRQHYFENKKYLPYIELDHVFKTNNNLDYRSLPTQTAQQTMKVVDQSFKSFFKSLKLPGKHKIPQYKDINGRFIVTYTSQQIRRKALKDGYISLPGLNCTFKTEIKSIKQIRFVPHDNFIVMEIVHEKPEKEAKTNNGRYASIDLGINYHITSL